jgi:hypothetical protein
MYHSAISSPLSFRRAQRHARLQAQHERRSKRVERAGSRRRRRSRIVRALEQTKALVDRATVSATSLANGRIREAETGSGYWPQAGSQKAAYGESAIYERQHDIVPAEVEWPP